MFGQVSTIERKASLNLIIRLFCLKEKNAFLLYIIFLYSFDITFIYFDFVNNKIILIILLFLINYSMIVKIILYWLIEKL